MNAFETEYGELREKVGEFKRFAAEESENYLEVIDMIGDIKNKEAQLKTIEAGVLNTVDLEKHVKHYMNALSEIKNERSQNQATGDLALASIPDYTQLLKRKIDSLKASDRDSPMKHRFYAKFEERAGIGQEDDDELTVMTTNSDKDFICPCTTMPFKEPMKGKSCTHTFSNAGIMQWLGNSHEKKCPVAGTCSPVLFIMDYLINTLFFFLVSRLRCHCQKGRLGKG
jgi:hypothetical protein